MSRKDSTTVVRRQIDEVRLTENELCEFWHIKPETLRRWRKSGNGMGLRYIKIGGRVLYDMADIIEFEKTRKYLAADQKVDATDNGGQDAK